MTLRANELRMGNIVTIDNKDSWPEMRDVPVIVTAVKGHMDEDEMRMFPNSRGEVHVLYGKDLYSQFDEFIKPIPLTEEWLIKFGFEKRDSSTCTQWFIGMNDVTHDWLFDLTWLENPVLINAPDAPFYRNGKHTIFYVHQLQNLYFALTGEELPLANHPV